MIEIAYVCLALLVIVWLFSIYRLMFIKPKQDTLSSWKIGLFLGILASLFFIVYFTMSIGSIGVTTTLTDGTVEFVQQSNAYVQLFNLMPLALAVLMLEWLFCTIEILRGISFFGRGRMTFD